MTEQGLLIRLCAQEGCDSMSLLSSLIDLGWRLDDHGLVRYLAAGDEDYDWKVTSVSNCHAVMEEIKLKVLCCETVGVVLTFGDLMIGGEWLFFTNGDVLFTPSINRQVAGGYSDVTWYLHRMLPAFEKGNMGRVESWRWEESF